MTPGPRVRVRRATPDLTAEPAGGGARTAPDDAEVVRSACRPGRPVVAEMMDEGGRLMRYS